MNSLAKIEISKTWTLFAWFNKADGKISPDDLKFIPSRLSLGEKTAQPVQITGNPKIDMAPWLGEKPHNGKIAFVYIPFTVANGNENLSGHDKNDGDDLDAFFGVGADWWYEAWIDGRPAYDTLDNGNQTDRYSHTNHIWHPKLKPGKHLLVIRFISGSDGSLLCVDALNDDEIIAYHKKESSTFPKLLSALTLHLRVRVGENGWNSTLFDWADHSMRSLRIYTRRAGENSADETWDCETQNYLSFPDVSGICDVLEAEVSLHSHNPQWTRMRVGVPAARIGKGCLYDIILRFTGSSLALFVDGVLVDEDWPVGFIPMNPSARPPYIAGKKFDGTVELVSLQPHAISDDAIVECCHGKEFVARRTLEILGPERRKVQYWLPRGHNQWVGDVMFGNTWAFDKERLHLFYLTDRRHHTSKFECGGHFVAHISSTDLINWEHHPIAVTLDEWNSLGTGRPISHNGKLVLMYGMHTDRVYNDRRNLRETIVDANDVTVPQPFSGVGKYPIGATYAESEDGIVFEKSCMLVHQADNPNVSYDNAGGYLLLSGADLWHSHDLQHWQLKVSGLIPLSNDSPVRPSSECLCMFKWNGWHYIIGGRSGFWMSRNQKGPYWEGWDRKNTDVVKPRWDIYEGLLVPMVAEFRNNRRILAGFTGRLYGGYLVFRELIQFADGTLGMKWPEEMKPAIKDKINPVIRVNGHSFTGNSISVEADSQQWAMIDNLLPSMHLSLLITPMNGTTHIGIAGLDDDGNGCVQSFMVLRGRVQWSAANGDALPEAIPSIVEIMADDNSKIHEIKNPHIHPSCGDFTITDVEGLTKQFRLELYFIHDAKIRGTLIDACINGERTMISQRNGLVVKKLRFMADGPAKFEQITIGRI